MPDYRYLLSEREIPKIWYNVIPDLPAPMSPPLHPGTLQPAGPQDLEAIFPHALIEQEITAAQNIPIPEPVLDILRLWRPTPLHRAIRLEKALGTPAKIFFKNEGVSPAGSHKPNTAIAQAYYNKAAGVKRLTTETGAGQWGSALSLACNVFGMECMVYMVKCSFYQKPHRRTMMECWGAKCVPSPSDLTQAGRKILAEDPETPGSLGIAISEAVEDAATHRGHQLFAGQRAEPRAAAPNRDRAGSHCADETRRSFAGHRHRLLRRREQFRRAGIPVCAR